MLSATMMAELRQVLQAQRHLLGKIERATASVRSTIAGQAAEISELQQIMDQIEDMADLLAEDDLAGFDPQEIPRLCEARRAGVAKELVAIGYSDWDSFVRQCQTYALHAGTDPFQPYEALLSEDDFKRLRAEEGDGRCRWDRWDYMFVGASGILAALTDLLLVGIPKDLRSGQYADQRAGLITPWLRGYDTTTASGWFADWARMLEQQCKVPYDATAVVIGDTVQKIPGMCSRSHRLQSLGHDPVLGFVFGVLDIMKGTISGFSYDNLAGGHVFISEVAKGNHQPVPLIEAILRHLGHLVSDLMTPSGLPAPFLVLFQGINAGSFGKRGQSVGALARWMYNNGYDLRHFVASGVTPATIEIVLRAYIMLRHYAEHGETRCLLASNPKYRSMLLAAHGIAAFANAGKVALYRRNPLAINQAEWLAFLRYLGPTVKYWVFDQQRLRVEAMERVSDEGWNSLLENSRHLLGLVASEDTPVITLSGVSP